MVTPGKQTSKVWIIEHLRKTLFLMDHGRAIIIIIGMIFVQKIVMQNDMDSKHGSQTYFLTPIGG